MATGGWSGRGLQPDAIAERLELADGPTAGPLGVAPYEVVAAEIRIVGVIGQQVPGDDEDGVADRDGRLLLADATGEAPGLGPEVRPAAARRGPGALGQDVAEPDVATARPARVAAATGDVVPGTAPSPGRQMGGAREDRHIDPDLGDDALGRPPGHPRDGVEVVTRRRERGDHPLDLLVERRDGALELLEVLQGEPDEQGMVVGEAAPQRLPERG